LIAELQELYQEVILDHNKNPRNFRALPEANRRAEGHNPLCGDHVTIFLHLDGDVIREVTFQGSGCAISKASASMMTASLKGKTRAEVEALFERFHRMVTGTLQPGEDPLDLGKLAAFAGVCEFPVRVKCASLAWHTLRAALEGTDQPVTTE
jgi:nitrogen fixation NifU-like protein